MSNSVVTSNSPSSSSPSRLSSSRFPKFFTSDGLLRRPNNDEPCSFSSPYHSDAASTSMSASYHYVTRQKRPEKLHIPISSQNFLEPEFAESDRHVVERVGDGYSVYCKKGRREAMEDRYAVIVNFQENPKQGFFGIFDGHSGTEAAEFAAANMGRNILAEVVTRGDDEMGEAIRNGYLNTDSQFLKGGCRGGSCCVTALIRHDLLIVSNAGDCRAVISQGGVAKALTSDHRPSRTDEKKRIQTLGGYIDYYHGVPRINGTLAVSRGIGDEYLKQWVIAEPETMIHSIKPEDEFLILASDGLWDKVHNQEAVDLVRSISTMGKSELLSASKKLVELSISRGSLDDTSVMLIHLRCFV